MRGTVIMPCLDDACTAGELIQEAARHLLSRGHQPSFLIVDDGSQPPLEEALRSHLPEPPCEVRVLRLKKNLGHQRAIACGLCWIAEHEPETEVIVVMDSDGEDDPADVPGLLEALAETPGATVAFAERGRRSERMIFRIGYRLYLLLHRVLAGQAPRVGNFSAITGETNTGLVTDGNLWSHYAATVWTSRQRRVMIPVHRAKRRRGSSRLGLASLVLHGLAAISCYGETLALRSIFGSGVIFIGLVITFLLLLRQALMDGPGAADFWLLISGCAAVLFLQLGILCLWHCLYTMQKRYQAKFMPLRDYSWFVAGCFPLPGAPDGKKPLPGGSASFGSTASPL